MVLKAEQERVHALLKDTITLLCKNGLSFKSEFSVEALIGITLDKNDVFLININEIIRSETCQKVTEYDRQGDVCSEEERDLSSEANSDSEQQPRRKQRKRRHKQIKTEVASGDEEASEGNNGACDEPQQQQASESHDGDDKDDEQKQSPADEKKVVKSDKANEPVQDIIIIKEETNEDWSQFGDMGTFPSGSAADISETTSNEQSFMSPSSSFMQSQPGTFDWSQGAAINQNQFATGTGTSSIDPNQQTLSGDLPCGICGKVLRKRSSLFVHLKRHEGKYNYNCPTCHKGFTSKSMLQGHMSWHTGVKEFKCTICQKEFRYPQDLRRHMAKMHGEGDER